MMDGISDNDAKRYYQRRMIIHSFGRWKVTAEQNQVIEQENEEFAANFERYRQCRDVFRQLTRKVSIKKQLFKNYRISQLFFKYASLARYLRQWKLFHRDYLSKHLPMNHREEMSDTIVTAYNSNKERKAKQAVINRLLHLRHRRHRSHPLTPKRKALQLKSFQSWRRLVSREKELKELFSLCVVYSNQVQGKTALSRWRTAVTQKEYLRRRYQKYGNYAQKQLLCRYFQVLARQKQDRYATQEESKQMEIESRQIRKRSLFHRWQRRLEERHHQKRCEDYGYIRSFTLVKYLRSYNSYRSWKEGVDRLKNQKKSLQRARLFLLKKSFIRFMKSSRRYRKSDYVQQTCLYRAKDHYQDRQRRQCLQSWQRLVNRAQRDRIDNARATHFHHRYRLKRFWQQYRSRIKRKQDRNDLLLQARQRHHQHKRKRALYLFLHHLFGDEDETGPRKSSSPPLLSPRRPELGLETARKHFQRRIFLKHYLHQWKSLVTTKKEEIRKDLQARQQSILFDWSSTTTKRPPSSHRYNTHIEEIREKTTTRRDGYGNSLISASDGYDSCRGSHATDDHISVLAKTPARKLRVDLSDPILSKFSPCSVVKPYTTNEVSSRDTSPESFQDNAFHAADIPVSDLTRVKAKLAELMATYEQIPDTPENQQLLLEIEQLMEGIEDQFR